MASALKFIIGGDATAFATAMKVVETSGTKAGAHTVQQFQHAAAEIEKVRAHMASLGAPTHFYDAALARVNTQMSELERQTMAAKMATDALAASRAKVALGFGDSADRRAVYGEHPLTGSEVTRQSNNATRITELRAEYERTKARREALTGSEVIRKGPMEEQLRQLRTRLMAGDDSARKEIRALVASRAAGGVGPSTMAGSRASIGAASTMLVSATRDSLASLASGANPLTVFLQQAPQVAQAATMVKGGVTGMWLAFMNLLSMKIGMFGSIAGILAGIAAGAIAAKLHTDKLIKSLAGVQMPDFDPEYIPKHLKATNAIAEGWKAVTKAVREAKENFDSVASASARQADRTTTEFEHRKKMLALEKELATAGAKSPGAKIAVSDKFRAKELALAEQQRQAEMQNAKAANEGFFKESIAMQNKANAIKVPSQMQDQNTLNSIKAQLAAANEAAKEVQDARNSTGFLGVTGRKAFQTYNSMTNSGVSTEDLVAAEDAILKKRNELRMQERTATDRMAENDVKRAEKARLSGKAQESAGKFITGRGDIKTQAQANDTDAKNQAEEARMQARIDRETARSSSSGGYSMELTSNQRIGAYMSGPQLGLLDVANKQLEVLKEIKTAVTTDNAKPVYIGGLRASK